MKSPVPIAWEKIRSRPLIRDTITTTGWATLGRAIGFMVPFFIAAWFGSDSRTDAFFFSYGAVLFLANIFAPVVEYIIVPFIASARNKKDDVGKFVGQVMLLSGIGLALLLGLLLPLTMPVLSLITRFDQPTLILSRNLLLETAPLVILLVWTGILSGTLNAYRKFAYPAVSPAFRAVVNLAVIFALRPFLGIHAIALGYVAGEAVRMMILLEIVRKLRLIRIRFSFSLSPVLRDFVIKASYQTVAMIVIWSKPIIDRAMASWLGEGNVSLLYYADRLYIIPITFICSGLMATTLSHWSTRYYESHRFSMTRDVGRAIKIVGWVSVLITVVLLIFYRPIAGIAYERGAFESKQVIEVQRIWFYYLLGLVPYVIGRIYFQAHLVLKNTRFLMIYAFGLNGLGILLNYILMIRFGVAGIALATTGSSLAAALSLGYFLRRRLSLINRETDLESLI